MVFYLADIHAEILTLTCRGRDAHRGIHTRMYMEGYTQRDAHRGDAQRVMHTEE